MDRLATGVAGVGCDDCGMGTGVLRRDSWGGEAWQSQGSWVRGASWVKAESPGALEEGGQSQLPRRA